MADDELRQPFLLETWAEVDPARYPFDPAEVPMVVRTMLPPFPRQTSGNDRSGGKPEFWSWVEAVGVALSDRYGPWAYRWYWGGPGASERLGWIGDRIPTQAEAPALVVDSLLIWRRWLESVAERFDQLLSTLEPVPNANPGDAAVAWEATFAQLMMAAVAPVVDNDGWQGWCRRVLRWFLTAAGMPVEEAEALVEGAVDKRFDQWVPLTAADINDIAERLARDALSVGGVVWVCRDDTWPDTWPQGWPTWRATNVGRVAG